MKGKRSIKFIYGIIGMILLVIIVLLGLSRTTLPHLGMINVRGVYTWEEKDTSTTGNIIDATVYRNGSFILFSSRYSDKPKIELRQIRYGHFISKNNKVHLNNKEIVLLHSEDKNYYAIYPLEASEINLKYKLTKYKFELSVNHDSGVLIKTNKNNHWGGSFAAIKKQLANEGYQHVSLKKFKSLLNNIDD